MRSLGNDLSPSSNTDWNQAEKEEKSTHKASSRDTMVDGIKSHQNIKEHKNRSNIAIPAPPQVIYKHDPSSVSTKLQSETWLKQVCIQNSHQLRNSHLLNNLSQKEKVGQ